MRARTSNQGLTVQAIAGTYAVLLGFDLAESDCPGLLGFAIHRTDHTEDEAYWLRGLKTFAETDPGFPVGANYSTREHPIQGFSWGDYSAKPGHDYTYRILALTGAPTHLTPAAEVSVRIQTESPASGNHDIFFNRGAAASQEYARRFGNRRPDHPEIARPAHVWLSRGLYEAMVSFIRGATGPSYALRVAAYEFHYPPVLEELAAAAGRGVDVRILYDHRKKNPGEKNEQAVIQSGLVAHSIPRKASKNEIAHNKFIVRLKDGQPEAVLTGGTNFTEAGIFGHSNVVHIVEIPDVAAAYLRYWTLVSVDPPNSALRPLVTAEYQLPAGNGRPPVGTGVLFSPRGSLDALDWLASLAASAEEGLFMTFAFGMNAQFQRVYASGPARLRYALMDKKTRPMKAGPDLDRELAAIAVLRAKPENRFAIGSHLSSSRFDRWLAEKLTGLNRGVPYVHTKYLMVDP